MFDRRLFFGREQVAASTLRRLGSRSVRLTGEHRIGKTSFLHHLGSALTAYDGAGCRFFPVFVDLEAVTATGLLHALMDAMIDALALPPRTLAELRFRCEPDGYPMEDFSHDLGRVVAELRRRTRGEVRLVLLLDEVDALADSRVPTGDEWLGRLIESGTRELRFVLAGVRPGGHAAIDELELEPLTVAEAEALVTRPVAGFYRYEARAVERILELSRLRPYLIQRLCLDAVNRMLDEGRTSVRAADVEARPFSVDEHACWRASSGGNQARNT